MVGQKKKSTKPSGTKSWQPDPQFVYFLDENTSSSAIVGALRAAGVRVEIQPDHFKSGTPDVDWLSTIADWKWIAITRDKRLRYRPNEIATIRAARARVIIATTSGNLTSIELAKLLVDSFKKIDKFVRNHQDFFIATIGKDGAIKKIE